MRLPEYEGKKIFQRYGIPVSAGIVAQTPEEAVDAARKIGCPVMVKAQVLAGGRGKAGGVKAADSEQDVAEQANRILGMKIKNEVVRCVLITEMCSISRELYAGITIDSRRGLPILIFSTCGGMDIEEVARSQPEKLITMHLSPLQTVKQYQIIDFLRQSDLPGVLYPVVSRVILQLIEAFYGADATTAEINPLAVTEDGKVLALDAKVVIDDSALKRQEQVQPVPVELTPLEVRAAKIGVTYVPLDGNIAVIAGGAGLALATMDLVSHFGGRPASFLDTGGGISSERMAEALRISLATPGVEGVIINVFGGINNCETMAVGIAEVIDQDRPKAKIVVKMRGHSQEEGWKLLEERHVPLVKYGTSEEAVQTLIHAVGGKANYGNPS